MIRTAPPPPSRGPLGRAPRALERARPLGEPAHRRALARLHPDLALVAGFHDGLVDGSGRPVEGGRGKAIRPALAMISAEAVGADPTVAIPGAVAVELVHDFSLLHDDVMDGDRERRHRPAAWAQFGVSPAILAGDALVVLAHQVLIESANPHASEAVGLLAAATQAMVAGQADDLAFERRLDVSPEEWLRMAAGKTGALLSCAAAIGAVLAGTRPATERALREFGLHLGLAYQAVDDLLGIWGAPHFTGKPAGTDLLRRKKTLPVVAAVAAGGPNGDRLRVLMATPPVADGLPDPLLPELVQLVESAGGAAAARAEAVRHLDRSVAALSSAPLEPAIRAELEELARFVVEREA